MRTAPGRDDLRGKAKTISIDTFTRRLTAFKALHDNAQTSTELLDMQQDTIFDQLAALTTRP